MKHSSLPLTPGSITRNLPPIPRFLNHKIGLIKVQTRSRVTSKKSRYELYLITICSPSPPHRLRQFYGFTLAQTGLLPLPRKRWDYRCSHHTVPIVSLNAPLVVECLTTVTNKSTASTAAWKPRYKTVLCGPPLKPVSSSQPPIPPTVQLLSSLRTTVPGCASALHQSLLLNSKGDPLPTRPSGFPTHSSKAGFHGSHL